MMRILLALCFCTLPVQAEETSEVLSAPSAFRFHVFADPVSLSPLKAVGSFNSYIHTNLFNGLMMMKPKGETGIELAPRLAKSCVFRAPKLIECEIRAGLKWSNGKPITRDDFIRPFRQAFASDAPAEPKADLIGLLNAKLILLKKKKVGELGVLPHPTEKNKIIFHFEKPDADFIYKLASPVFGPRPAKFENEEALARDFATGPYRLKEWKPGISVLMEPNPFYDGAPADLPLESRPLVKALVVAEDATAFKLYQTGELDFLRRVPAEHHKSIQDSPELKKTPFLRMDYIGFSHRLKNQLALRDAIVHAINYEEFKSLFFARGRPGCFGLSAELYDGEPPCYTFDLAKARKSLAQVSPAVLKEPFDLYYNLQGGDDILRAVQFFENQLKKNLKLKLNLQGLETSQMHARLVNDAPDLFRRGVPVETPTCLGAVQVFEEGNPDNFIQFTGLKSEWEILQMPTALAAQKRTSCTVILKGLLEKASLIPLGEQHFMVMAKNKFTGWQLNALNQLDLSGLRAAP